jgi:hypothetical protein
MVFDDMEAVAHAVEWARRRYRPHVANELETYLQSLDEDEQEWIAEHGYRLTVPGFEKWLKERAISL